MGAEIAPDGWNSFFGAVASASASLAGLMFVALSINLSRILEAPGLTERAAEALSILSGALIAALLALIPGQPARVVGTELTLLGLLLWCLPVVWQVRAIRARLIPQPHVIFGRLLLHQAATLPIVWGALALTGLAPHGRYWLALGLVLSLISSLINAWVLLVEIVR